MKDNTYLVPRNSPCPICRGLIVRTKSGQFYICNDCHRVYRPLYEDMNFGGEHDQMLECINEERIKNADN